MLILLAWVETGLMDWEHTFSIVECVAVVTL